MNLPVSSSVSVLLFGITRDLTGLSSLLLTVRDGDTVGGLLSQLYGQYPALSGIKSILVAVNGEYAETDQVLSQNDEIALIPPVSGG